MEKLVLTSNQRFNLNITAGILLGLMLVASSELLSVLFESMKGLGLAILGCLWMIPVIIGLVYGIKGLIYGPLVTILLFLLFIFVGLFVDTSYSSFALLPLFFIAGFLGLLFFISGLFNSYKILNHDMKNQIKGLSTVIYWLNVALVSSALFLPIFFLVTVFGNIITNPMVNLALLLLPASIIFLAVMSLFVIICYVLKKAK